MEDNKLIIYKNSDGNIIVDAIYKDETLWLSQKGMSKVFNVGVPAISKHLKNILFEFIIRLLFKHIKHYNIISCYNKSIVGGSLWKKICRL